MQMLHEIAISYANKQKDMIDELTEETPVLQRCKFIPSTHGLTNVAEKLTEITGPTFVEADSPLPFMGVSTDLERTDLFCLGGQMEVPTYQAQKFGGAEQYFAKHQTGLLRQSGMDMEKLLIKNYWLKAARIHKNMKSAGASGGGHVILAVRFDELANVGLFDPDQYESGRFFKITPMHNGGEYPLENPKYSRALGYGVVYRSILGWQVLDGKRTCAAIVNIDKDNRPTVEMIEEMIHSVRGTPANTIIICGPYGKLWGLTPHKKEYLQMTGSEKDVNLQVESWMGIPVIMTYNLNDPAVYTSAS